MSMAVNKKNDNNTISFVWVNNIINTSFKTIELM